MSRNDKTKEFKGVDDKDKEIGKKNKASRDEKIDALTDVVNKMIKLMVTKEEMKTINDVIKTMEDNMETMKHNMETMNGEINEMRKVLNIVKNDVEVLIALEDGTIFHVPLEAALLISSSTNGGNASLIVVDNVYYLLTAAHVVKLKVNDAEKTKIRNGEPFTRDFPESLDFFDVEFITPGIGKSKKKIVFKSKFFDFGEGTKYENPDMAVAEVKFDDSYVGVALRVSEKACEFGSTVFGIGENDGNIVCEKASMITRKNWVIYVKGGGKKGRSGGLYGNRKKRQMGVHNGEWIGKWGEVVMGNDGDEDEEEEGGVNENDGVYVEKKEKHRRD